MWNMEWKLANSKVERKQESFLFFFFFLQFNDLFSLFFYFWLFYSFISHECWQKMERYYRFHFFLHCYWNIHDPWYLKREIKCMIWINPPSSSSFAIIIIIFFFSSPYLPQAKWFWLSFKQQRRKLSFNSLAYCYQWRKEKKKVVLFEIEGSGKEILEQNTQFTMLFNTV